MILGIWRKANLYMIGTIELPADYDRDDDKPFQKTKVQLELEKFGYDINQMDYAIFENLESCQRHINGLFEERAAMLSEISAKLKETKTSG